MKKVNIASILITLFFALMCGCSDTSQNTSQDSEISASKSLTDDEIESKVDPKPVENQNHVYKTEDAYQCAINLDSQRLETNSLTKQVSYKGITIVTDTIDKDSMYLSIAKGLVGYHFIGYEMWGKNIVKVVWDMEKPSAEELRPYVESAEQFITEEPDALARIMKKFQSCESVSGSFDFENEIYNFNVPDLTITAHEMGISEEMLGYIFAYLDCYAPEIKFEQNSCTFNLTKYQSQHNWD